ncbi:hypothetical protein RJT34_18777 [Clitoria ternatea]|uniref:Uncharacterized protein n=1 Tax=Clitoria ternatea TaxID=43366 RepID=A0AAN9PEN2_CLITE
MDDNNKKKKVAGLISKTWERCKSSIGRGRRKARVVVRRSKSWPSRRDRSGITASEGCFSVYVGPQMQRFVIKTEYANHPLFKMLLEEAESEYGYNAQGPLLLPCQVHIFYKVLMEIDYQQTQTPHGCAFLKPSPSSYQLLTPSSHQCFRP